MQENHLPYNIEAEEGTLGSIIIDPEAIAKVCDFLQPEDFYRNAHQDIYAAMLTLWQERESPDFITLCDYLSRRGKLVACGGASYITSLLNGVPTSGGIERYGHIVETNAILRRLIHAAGEIAATAYNETDANEAVSRAEALIYEISQGRKKSHVSSIADVMSRYMNRLDSIHQAKKKGVVTGVPTGFRVLDQVLGGLQPSDLIVLAARPAVGKTSFALNVAQQVMLHSYNRGYKTLMFSLEMSEEQLARRLMSMQTGIDQTRLRTADIEDEEWETITGAFKRLSEGSMWIDDTAGLSLMDMRARALRAQSEHGLDLVIVDYMQLLHARSVHGKAPENRVQEVSQISRDLKELARELKVPVLALAQLSRAVEQRADKVPQLSDLRESGTIEQDSDVVMFLHEEPKSRNDTGYQLNVMIAKHRNGPVGVAPLWFHAALTRFGDVEERLR